MYEDPMLGKSLHSCRGSCSDEEVYFAIECCLSK